MLSRATKSTALVLALLFLFSCSMGKGLGIAKQAVEQFHRQQAAAQDDAIYDAASTEYKQAVTKETNHGLMARIRRKMGACQDSSNSGFFTRATTSGTFVDLNYTTKCANGNLEEKFTWRIEGDHALLLGYHVGSPLLLTD